MDGETVTWVEVRKIRWIMTITATNAEAMEMTTITIQKQARMYVPVMIAYITGGRMNDFVKRIYIIY